jgi:hypothetical protein
MDPLTTHLLDLLYELEESSIPLMIGGGFGLFLKRRHLDATGQRTLLASLPEPRATNDLDLFLRAEILSNLQRTREVRAAFVRLGYAPVDEARFLQWKREVVIAGVPRQVKIDVLVGPLGRHRSALKVSPPRVRPRGEIEFHAHTVEEAVLIEEHPVPVPVSGVRSNGAPHAGTVDVPDAFPYLVMKLHAFADRLTDANRDLGRHHALDLYTIVGMMTEPEYERARRWGAEHAQNPHVARAGAIVRDHFAADTSLGALRLREHVLFRSDFALDTFRDVLRELLPTGVE